MLVTTSGLFSKKFETNMSWNWNEAWHFWKEVALAVKYGPMTVYGITEFFSDSTRNGIMWPI